VPVPGPVDLLDPGPQPGDRLLPPLGGQLPPRRSRFWLITVAVTAGLAGRGEVAQRGSVLLNGLSEGGGLAGELGQPAAGGGVMIGFAGIEAGELVGVGGELVDDGGDGVGAGHGHQLQGWVPPWPGIQ
jgi:hypothetical protein